MSDNAKTIKVVDRRLFTADGDLREEHRQELENPAPAPAAAEEKPAAPPEPVIETSEAFLGLLDMLAQTASLYLEGIPDPATGRRAVDLNAARQIIDSIVVLREKTRGRLSFEESNALEGLVGQLQLVFSNLATRGRGRPVPGTGPAPGARRG